MATHEERLVVEVWETDFEITVYQKSKAVWIAVGQYKGKRLQTKGPTRQSAVARWREAARYRGKL